MKNSKLEKYEKIENNIFATVKFVSDIISKKDKNDNIIEGNPDRIKQLQIIGSLQKISSQSPNWYLSEILSK